MSAEVFQNANVSILACQLFVMLVALTVTIVLGCKQPATPAVKGGAKI